MESKVLEEILAFVTDGMRAGSLAGEPAKIESLTYLDGKTGLMTEVSQSDSTTSSSEEWNGVPIGRKYDSAKAATFRSLPSAQERATFSAGRRQSNIFQPQTNGNGEGTPLSDRCGHMIKST